MHQNNPSKIASLLKNGKHRTPMFGGHHMGILMILVFGAKSSSTKNPPAPLQQHVVPAMVLVQLLV